MNKNFLMDCRTVMDIAYESEKDSPLPILTRMRIWLHLLYCPDCSGEISKLRNLEEVMKTDFFPPSPDFEEPLMECIYQEAEIEEETDAPTGFSLKSWVFTGFFVLLSLSSSFFGMNFEEIAKTEGSSFLLPVGLTIGMVVTCYGALFIGSHLKELSARFRLR
jgi:hypothetical protein